MRCKRARSRRRAGRGPDAGAAGGRPAGAGAACRAIRRSATSPTAPERVALLWEACALPDYRKIAPAQHADLIASIFTDLVRCGHVDENYMAEQVRRADSTDGDIDTLSQRIAQIRTWTFVSNRPGWLADPTHWQEKTREIEDRLSDALHERLTKRFVDRRTSVLMRRLRENTMLEAEISPTGECLRRRPSCRRVAGLPLHRRPARRRRGRQGASRLLRRRRSAAEFEARADRFARLRQWRHRARLRRHRCAGSARRSARWLAGERSRCGRASILLADEQLTGPARDKVAARAERFVNYQIEHAAEAARSI